jgi:hypothetical protein
VSSVALGADEVLIQGVAHGHNIAKPNSPPNITPTAPNSKNANSYSPTSSLDPLPPPQLTAAETTPSLQKVKSSHKLPPTSQPPSDVHTS